MSDPAGRLPAAPGAWDPEADDALVCRAVHDETPDVRTFVLAPRSPARFAFRPGQFLTFAFPIGAETIHRCYTIASPPTRPDTVSITVKRVPGGPVSTWLHERLRPGDTVRALGPMGTFTCVPDAGDPGGAAPPRYLFLSGGSGITPLMSMARAFGDLGLSRDVVFVHAARTPADIVFRAELAVMSRRDPGLRLAFLVERDAPAESWAGHRGRISRPFLDLACPDFRDRTVFCCGPAPFMAAVRALLDGAGFDRARYHEESFDFAALPGAEQGAALAAERALDDEVPPAPAARSFTVLFAKTRREIAVREDQTVLEVARRQGIRLPSSCTKGLCGTCKSKIVSGSVAMTHAGGIRQREIDAGMALLCCSRPLSDLVVDR